MEKSGQKLVHAIVIKSLPARGFAIAKGVVGSESTYMIHKKQQRGFNGKVFDNNQLLEIPSVDTLVALRPVTHGEQMKAEIWGVIPIIEEKLRQLAEDHQCDYWMNQTIPDPTNLRYKEDALIVAAANIPVAQRRRIRQSLLRERGGERYRRRSSGY